MSDFASQWEQYRERAERALTARLPDAESGDASARLHQAMRYACLNGGKRFRAMLVYGCGAMAGASPARLDVPAAAVEMVHAYSLIHDDLPAMDDDDLRRGRPSCHLAYDEATAILAGDALQTLGFHLLATDPALTLPAESKLRMIAALAQGIGASGMAGGQALDMAVVNGAADGAVNGEQLIQIHRLKTGALIRAAAGLGGLAGGADETLLAGLECYAADLGLAFQIVDDLLDGDGKADGPATPATPQNPSYVSLFGSNKARADARNLCQNAQQTIAALASAFPTPALPTPALPPAFPMNPPPDSGHNPEPPAAFLQQLAHFVVNRNF